MMTKSRWGGWSAVVLLAAGLPAPSPSRAEVFADILDGLAFAGFDLQGQRNIIGNGANIRLVNQFQNQTFDAGLAELTLNGPISIEIATADRLMSTFDVSVQTALTRELTPQPLAYNFFVDVGGQHTRVSGDLIIDGDFSINGMGFYNGTLSYSSRQTTQTEGRFGTENNITNDYDIGPIDIRGNIFADLLGAITDPIWEASNTFNPFESFSGRQSLLKAIEEAEAEAGEALAEGETIAGDELARIAGMTALSELLSPQNLLAAALNGGTQSAPSAAYVPEPTTALLMLVASGALLSPKLRRRWR